MFWRRHVECQRGDGDGSLFFNVVVALVFVLLSLCCCVVFGLLLTFCLCLRSYRLFCVCFRFAFVLISFLVDFMLRTWYFLVAPLGSRFTTSRSTDDIRRWWGPVVNRRDGGSMPPTAVSKLSQFLHPTFACVFRKDLKTGGPFCLVSMPGEVKDPTQEVNV